MIGAFVDLGRGLARWRTSFALATQDISLRYRRSVLGPFWISASLVCSVLALSYVFGSILGQDMGSYSAYIGAGLLVWTFMTSATSEASSSVMEHGPLLQNLPMPLPVVAGRVMIRNAIILVHNAIAIFIVLAFFGVTYTPVALLAVPGMLVLMASSYFLVLVLGPLSARYRDIPQIVSSVLQLLFFVTPIVWMRDQMGDRTMLADGNPLFHLIELVRAPLLGDAPTELNWTVGLSVVGALAVMALISVAASRKRVALWV